MPPPPGVTPNFDNPESIAHRVIIVSVLGAAITIPICLIRLYTKRYILRNVGWDDYSIVVATILALGFSIYVSYQTTNGLGYHIWEVTAEQFYTLMKIGDIAGPILYNLATLFTKVSLGAFYLRISPFERNFRMAVYAVVFVSIVNSLLSAFGFVWVCQPIAKYWDFTITTGTCINLNAYFLSSACINAATDLALLVLPIFIMHKLQLALHRKIGAALLLMTGSFVCVVSLIRVAQVVKGMHLIPTDGTWGMVINFIWMLTEMWLGIICACLPILYTFVRTHVRAKRGSGDKVAYPAVRDPNSGQIGYKAPAQAPDSGYHSGHMSNFSLDQLDAERRGHYADHEHGVRPATSDKSLLITTSRCSD
ncbi:hypothetical protein P153DRAFT_287580 [Dothidotthia symphoricarpi CBS 119687]|uniref:Rhodopsin domain-containing protein n=1 Tax=Dothidotthia symphoricarpi CBS 119687 TaxID=1392245 RepID=A0A6A6AHE4_9PLEO|nr:uncharacterized protein P153DRAFT_287580 [Dothidotthia symphoricarpi CBS 119687]KAF2131230.1 hypothetical protein P153DRAFT_287580 [Dothidotthia symphoricarpi CBS 119687]